MIGVPMKLTGLSADFYLPGSVAILFDNPLCHVLPGMSSASRDSLRETSIDESSRGFLKMT